jgi:1,2-dihydroxy-3-keto-5-methylthiopentene dioxygenase
MESGMTHLTTYADASPFAASTTTSDRAQITASVAKAGVTLERWQAQAPLLASATDTDIAQAYAADIERLKTRGGYQSHDVIRLAPDHPQRAALRQKFLAEHIHDDDEVRFFVEGSGLFYIRHAGAVLALECTAGDLIVLPAGTRHWFDTGEAPSFTAIRLFTSPDGWEARYTGDSIAQNIPLYEGATPT